MGSKKPQKSRVVSSEKRVYLKCSVKKCHFQKTSETSWTDYILRVLLSYFIAKELAIKYDRSERWIRGQIHSYTLVIKLRETRA